MNILLKSATLVDANNPQLHLKKRDILIEDGSIKKISPTIPPPKKAELIELPNLHVSLGWFDSSVSFGEPGFEERETLANGLLTAAKSGFTDIVLNTNTQPAPSTGSDITFFKERSKTYGCTLHPMGCLTAKRMGERLAELFDMYRAGAVAFSDYKNPTSNANLIKIALQYAQNFGGLVLAHPQNGQLAPYGVVNEGETATRLGLKGIPNLSEELQLVRDLYVLEYTGGKLHVPTISTAKSVQLIAEAKKKGLDVSCSVALHHLFLTDDELQGFDSNYKVTPPLRTKKDSTALLAGLTNGTVDFITSDHCPIAIEGKRKEFDLADFGTIGLESAFGALNQLLPMQESIALLTKGRERFGLPTPKLAEGEHACLTLFNPEGGYTFGLEDVLSSSKNSAFYGKQLKGKAYGSINNSKLVLRWAKMK